MSEDRTLSTIGVERAAAKLNDDCRLFIDHLQLDDDGVVTAALQFQRAAACVTTQMFQHSDSQQWASTRIAAALVKCKVCGDWRWLESSGMSV